MAGIGLKTKVTIAVSMLIAVIILAITYFHVRYFGELFKNTILEQQITLTSAIADEFDSKISSCQSLLVGAARELAIESIHDPVRARNFLAHQTGLLTTFDNGIFLYDRFGTLVAEAPIDTGRIGDDFSSREYFTRTVSSRKPVISAPYLSSQKHHHPVIMFTVPLLDHDRKLVGILAGGLDLVQGGGLSKITSIHPGKNGFMYVMDMKRTIIMHPEPARILKQETPSHHANLGAATERAWAGTEERLTSEGVVSLVSYKRLQSVDWVMCASFPAAEVYAPFLRIKKYIVLLSAPVLLLTVVLTFLLMKYFTRPLLVFAEHVGNLPLKKGEDRFFEVDSAGGELSVLAESFNRMVENLDNQKIALLESEELHRTLIEFTSEFIFWRSADQKKMLYVSPHCVHYTGYTDVEFYLRPGLLDEIIYVADREKWRTHVDVACRGEHADPLELRFATKAGGVCWVNHLCRPVLDEDGQLLGVRGSFADISDRKRVEEAQWQQFHLLQTLIDAIPAPVFFKDAKGAYLGCNTAFETFTGLSRADIVGKTVFQLFPEDLAKVYHEADNALFMNPGVQRYEAGALFNEGNMHEVIFYKSTFYTIDGSLGGLVGTMLDVTDRNKVELALRSSEEKFRLFFQESKDAIFVTDAGWKLVDANQSANELFGYSPEEIAGLDSCTLFCDKACWDFLLNELMSNGHIREVEVGVSSKKGATFVCLLSASLRKTESGEILGFHGILHDITERKRAEEVLIRQNEYLAALNETTKGLISRLDLNSLLNAIINRAGALMKTNHSYIYLLNRATERMVRESTNGVFTDFFDQTIEKGHGVVGTVWENGVALALDNYPAWTGRLPDPAREVLRAMIGVPLKSGEEVIGVIGLAHMEEGKTFGAEEVDILSRFAELASLALDNARLYEAAREELHERKRAEEQLRKLSHAVEQSPASVVITDPAGTIEYVNPKFTEVTGYTEGEVIGENTRILKGGNSAIEHENLWQMITSGNEWSGEFHNKKKSGELFWELASISPIRDADGVITHFIAVKEDITERKKLEDQLRHSQKMEAVGKLAGGIAHDFNNIMTAIIGYATILKMKLDNEGSCGNSINQILFSAKRATNLIEGLLAFSRKQVTNLRPVKLNDVVARVQKILERLIGEDIDLITTFADPAPVVMVDALQIEQVLMNLATNARDAMPEGGSLTITTELVMSERGFPQSYGLSKEGAYAKLTVADTGIGMGEDTTKKIFDPFFTTKAVGKGTGLGLAIAYGIIEEHGGSITCYSEPGQGTTFFILLPAIEAQVDEVSPEAAVPALGGSETILIAEDDGVVREYTRELLVQYGYNVLLAMDGEEAVTKFKENPDGVQLVIIDLIMPKKNGREAYDEIRKLRPDVKAIFSSGYEADVFLKKGRMEAGVNYLAKPVTPANLLTKVREVLDT